MPVTLDELVLRMDRDHRAASEALAFLPTFIDPVAPNSVDVAFSDATRTVPTLKALRAAIDEVAMQAEMSAVRSRVDQLDTLSQGMISALSKLGAPDGPTWSTYDLTSNDTVSDMTDPMYRANVENGIRYPFDAYIVVNIDRRNPDDWAKIGNVLLPAHSTTVTNAFTGAIGSVATAAINASQYPAFSKTVERYGYGRLVYVYGRYYLYGWRIYPSYYRYYSDATYFETITTPLDGSQVAQTFQVTTPQILKGLRLWSSTAGSGLTTPPTVWITESSFGMPDTAKVIGRANVVADAAYLAGQGATAASLTDSAHVKFALVEPIYLQPGKSYAFVVLVPGGATYNLYTTANGYAKGGLFYTQDSAMWTQDLAKDLLFAFETATFTAGTQYVEINPLSVSGGIASVKSEFSAIIPESTTVSLEVDINGIWHDVSVIDGIDQLPPYTPARLKVVATATAAPVIDTIKSRVTAFRAAPTMRFTAKARPIAEPGTIRLSIATAGFDLYDAETMTGYHGITFTVKCDGEATLYSPTAVRPVYGSNKAAQFEVTFTVPVNKTTYQLLIAGTTTLATRVFDVTNIVEI